MVDATHKFEVPITFGLLLVLFLTVEHAILKSLLIVLTARFDK